MSNVSVLKLSKNQIQPALELVWEVFCQFEAPEYSDEGINEFRATLDNSEYTESMQFYGAFEDNELVGVLGMRKPQHIGLFFVKASCHRRGIGRLLFETMQRDYDEQKYTVNASPYAVEVYKHLGFYAVDNEKTTNGIRYTPMAFG